MPRKPRPTRSETPAAGRTGRTGQSPLSFFMLWGFVTLALGYLIVFYRADALSDRFRREAIIFIASPDGLFELWCGGDVDRFTIADRWPLAALAAVILVGAGLAGRLALRLLGLARVLDRLERLVFSLGVGLNLMSLHALAAGLAGGLQQRWLFILPLVILATANAALAILDRRGQPRLPPPDASRPRGDRLWLWWLVPAAPWAIVIVLAGMLPPTAYDVREYHLQAPKEWFQNGRIEFLPHNIYANMPLGSELNSLWAMALAFGHERWWWGAVAGKTVMACYSLITAAALVAFGRRVHSLGAGVIAASVFLSTPWIVILASAGYNEGPVALYALLAIYALWLAANAKEAGLQPRLVALAGFCAGSAVACKYPPALFLVVPLTLWLAGFGWRAGKIGQGMSAALQPPAAPSRARADEPFSWRKSAATTAVFLAFVAAGCGLWFGKNLVLAGNPTYPLLYSLFDGRTRTPEKDRQWTRVHSPQPDAAGRRFTLRDFANQAAWVLWKSRWSSVAIVPLALVAWLAPRPRGLVAALLLWMLFVFSTWWLFTHRLDRFLILLLPLAALLAGIGAVALPHAAWRTATLALVAWGLVAQFPVATLPADNGYFVPLEMLRRDDPDLHYGGDFLHPAHRWLNDHQVEVGRVLLVGDAEPFNLEVPATYNTCFDDCQFTRLFKDRSRQERLAALRAEGITHVFFHWPHLARYRSPGNYGYTSDYPTPQLVHEELIGQHGLLQRIEIGVAPAGGELFEVVRQ